MNWKLCVSDPQGRALILCRGSMDKGDGFGYGSGNSDVDGGDGDSPSEWV